MNRCFSLKKYALILCAATCVLLCGCTQTSPQVENQAYVLVMGLDRNETGDFRLSVLIPKIAGTGSEGKPGDSQYTFMSVQANDFESALERLNWAMPREVNFAHLKLIAVSAQLASETDFRFIIENVAQTERLYTASRVVICEGSAHDFVKDIKPSIGTRVSTDINAMYDHYTAAGYLPESSLADLYYLTESVYSDPMVSYAVYNPQSEDPKEAKPVSATNAGVRELSASTESDISNRYLGAALFRSGRFCGALNGTQTMLANLLRNEVKSFKYVFNGQCLQIVPTRQVFIDVDTKSSPAIISIDARLSIASQEQRPDENALRAQLENDILDTIYAARAMGAEPFGFADRAARHFPTLKAWQEYNWPSQFPNAKIQLQLSFARADS